MAGYHRFRDAPLVVETSNGRMRFVISEDYVAFGIDGAPLFATEGDSPGRIVGRLPDSDGSPIPEGEWSPSLRFLPVWVEFTLDGGTEPDFHCRVELRDNVPRVVEMCYRASESQAEIRQKHLRATQIEGIANTVYRQWITEVRDVWRSEPDRAVAVPSIDEDQDRILRDLVYDARLGRRVDTAMLRQVAEVYRANFGKAPAEAVARTFGVKQRMAHEYVRRARERGFLPPTTQGKKKI